MALALLAAGWGCGSDPELTATSEARAGGPPPPIVLISIDTLRSDRLPLYGYDRGATPAIDALGADSLLFERAYAHVPLTMPSHASILTGLLPPAHGVRDNLGYRFEAAGLPYLPRLLRDSGYATGAAVSAYSLRGRVGFASGFDFYDDRIPVPARTGLGGIQRSGAATLSAALDWLRQAAGEPFFLFLHLFEPHTPYAPLEPFASRHASAYDGEVAAADAVVADLIAELKRLEAYDRAVIVLLSDHGEGLSEHGEEEHGVLLYREALQVPLLLKLPAGDRAGHRVATSVQMIDIAPTLLELAGLPLPPGLEGRSLLSVDEHAAPRPVYAESWYPRLHFGWSQLGSMIEGPWHLIDGPDPELYDLVADPGETDNLIRRRAGLAARLRQELDARTREPAPPGDETEEARRALAALGYVGLAAAAPEAELPDPKSRLGTVEEIKNGLRLYSAGEFARAATAYRKAVESNPGSVDAWEYLGRSLTPLGRHEEALAAWREAFRLSGSTHLALAEAQTLMALQRPDEALERLRQQLTVDPADQRLLMFEARTLATLGRFDEALTGAEAALRLAPDSADALYLRGAIRIGRRQLPEAERDLRRALEIAPGHTAAMSDLAMLLQHRGDLVAARRLLEEVLSINPEDANAARHLRNLERQTAD
jgi:arylsulfatase A-like enzyme/cytochrome c-type biogenesis protein CcmH/NrfG